MVEINMQSIPTAHAQACYDGMAVSWVTPSDKCVRLTAIKPTVVAASGETDHGIPVATGVTSGVTGVTVKADYAAGVN
jgi:hypothetical protein